MINNQTINVQLLHEHNVMEILKMVPEDWTEARPVLAEYMAKNNERADWQAQMLSNRTARFDSIDSQLFNLKHEV